MRKLTITTLLASILLCPWLAWGQSGLAPPSFTAGSAFIATYGTAQRTVGDRAGVNLDARDFGAIWDGNSHPISGIASFAGQNSSGWTLSQWQTYFPEAQSLSDEIDGLAVQAGFDFCATQSATNHAGGCNILVPTNIQNGTGTGTGLTSIPLNITGTFVSLLSRGKGFQLRSPGDNKLKYPTRIQAAANYHGGYMLTVAPVANHSSGYALAGNNVSGILFDCNNVTVSGGFCGGVLVESNRNSVYDVAVSAPVPLVVQTTASVAPVASGLVEMAVPTADISVGMSISCQYCLSGTYVASIVDSAHLYMSVGPYGGTIPSSGSVAFAGEGFRTDVVDLDDGNTNSWDTFSIHAINTTGAQYLTAPLIVFNGTGPQTGTGTYGNTAQSIIPYIQCHTTYGDCLVLNNEDHLTFNLMQVYDVGGGSENAVVLNGSNNTNLLAAGTNRFNELDTALPILLRGTTYGFTTAPLYNFFNIEAANGTPSPTVDYAGGAMGCTSSDKQPIVGCVGSNSFVSAQLADSGVNGGNARGAHAVDLQQIRGSATQVASSTGGVIGGGNSNSVTGSYAEATGLSNVASGTESRADGANANTFNGTGWDCYSAAKGSGFTEACKVVLTAPGGSGAMRLTADGTGTASAINCLDLPVAGYATTLSIQLILTDETSPGNSYSWIEPLGVLYRPTTVNTTAYTTLATAVGKGVGTGTTATVSETADTTNACLNLTVTPPAATVDKWVPAATVTFTLAE